MNFFIGKRVGNQRSPNRTGCDGVDADAAWSQLLRQCTRERDDSAFGGRVVDQVVHASISRNGGSVNNGSPGLEMVTHELGHENRTEN